MALVQRWCDRHGYVWRDISVEATPWRKGISIPSAEPELLVFAIEAGTPCVYISGGVLRGVADRLRALEAANAWTRSNPAFPCFVPGDDASGTTSIVQQLKFPLALLADAPEFARSSIDHMADVLLERRGGAIEDGIAGVPFATQDYAYLFAASL